MKKVLLGMLLWLASLGAFSASVSLSSGAACTYSQASVNANGDMVFTCVGSPPPPTPPAGPSCNEKVTRLYREVLLREPDPGGLAHWTMRCDTGMSDADMLREFRSVAPPPPPTGNPSAIVPSWGSWAELWKGPSGERPFRMHSGQVAAFQIVNPENRDGLTFTMGETPIAPPNNVVEFYLSRTPGIIDPADVLNYERTQPHFSGYYSLRVWLKESIWNAGNPRMQAYGPGPWYLNTRWTYPPATHMPGGHSIQWAR